MSFFNFPLPTRAEIEAVKEFARSSPELLDGRELWILRGFWESEFQ